mgnify:FL=1
MTEAEFLPLFDQYRPMVYGLALSYTRSPQDAEDVCQEVFLTLLEKPPAPGKERPWLARVAVNRCRDLLTSPWRRRRENDDTALERLTFETPEEAGLFAALGALSPDSRALLHLRYYEGFTVAELARRCVIQGKADGSFGYADPLQRCDGAVLLMRVLEQVDDSCRGESQTVTLHILNADTGEALLPDQQVETEVSTYLSSLANGLDVGYYVYDYDRETASYTSTACDSYTLYFRPMTGAEIQEEQFWEKVERGEAAYEDYYKQDFWLNFQGDNARKHILLFGDESKSRFASQEEAAAAMTTVTVPVWQLSGGEKVSSTLTLSVHAALAEDVKEIFTEIYNDPERFPIHDVGGYAWRGDSATGEHNCGTAIDINANENYQIRDGQVLAGSCWEPGTNPRSISPHSSVVRIFAEHGWSWGGDAWAYSSDDSEGYHDYMHFSYMGE